MNVLLIGSGGREHALAFKLAQSAQISRLFIAPGNGGTQLVGENINLEIGDHQGVIVFCQRETIGLVVVGPEAPLVAGIVDSLTAARINVFGPSKAAALLEGSKIFTKQLCTEMNIPTASYANFDQIEPALAHVREVGSPIVIKADGLAAGKGVSIATNLDAAETALKDCFSGAFGLAGANVVIEECLQGEEVSLFALCDGEKFITLATAQDHKRAYDGDRGPNTGGMGAYSPAPVMSADLLERAEIEIIEPALRGMSARGTPFRGILFAGLMLTTNGPKLIEFNVRFGDPECQTLMMRLKSDLLEMLLASADGDIADIKPEWREEFALCVVMAAKGYPGSYSVGSEIFGAQDDGNEKTQIFHASTKRIGAQLLANGGRVLGVTALGNSVEQAQKNSYDAIGKIDWPEGYCRKDIGSRAITGKPSLV